MRTPAGIVAFYVAAVITVLLIASAALALALFLTVPRTAEPLLPLPDNTWWFSYHDPPQGALPAPSGASAQPLPRRASRLPRRFEPSLSFVGAVRCFFRP